MALIGLSLLFASFLVVCLRPPAWLPAFLAGLRQKTLGSPTIRPSDGDDSDVVPILITSDPPALPQSIEPSNSTKATSMPPPPRMNLVPEPPAILSTPAFGSMPPPPIPLNKRSSKPSGIPQPASSTSSSSTAALPRRLPTLNNTLSSTPTRARNLPIPQRGAPPPRPSSSSLGANLLPPPTATTIPKKPSRQVTLEPGHSPLDWARLAQSPTSDLRNLPPNTPYMRVTPSMLKQQNGRKGRDAWTAYGGKVYNVTPYVPFHPGGKGELLRGAGKDGTRLFAEVHPWVNYETMLQSCLIGLLVEE
ncbi:hypothetical protein BD289DRAFT_346406, partial [Coniella lustricola]